MKEGKKYKRVFYFFKFNLDGIAQIKYVKTFAP